ncbi:MAG: single-stranded DNA-binding protein [Actinomycetota bacterium]
MNVVVIAGTVAADPVERTMPSGDAVTEFRVSVPEAGKRLLPLPVAAWHAAIGKRTLAGIGKGDEVLVHGQLVRRFYRSGAGARSLTEVVASGIKKLERPAEPTDPEPVAPPQRKGRSTRPVRGLGQK